MGFWDFLKPPHDVNPAHGDGPDDYDPVDSISSRLRNGTLHADAKAAEALAKKLVAEIDKAVDAGMPMAEIAMVIAGYPELIPALTALQGALDALNKELQKLPNLP